MATNVCAVGNYLTTVTPPKHILNTRYGCEKYRVAIGNDFYADTSGAVLPYGDNF